ncbi:MAG: Ldh family oxidoreductase [Pseudomonadota bacterium]
MTAPALIRVASGPLTEMLTSIFAAAGGAADEAEAIAWNLIEASLMGHDSHGVVRTERYVEWAEQGQVHFGRRARSVIDAEAFALLDGQNGFGQSVGREAVDAGIAKARAAGAAVVGLRRAGHLGRIGAWAERACAADLVSIHFVNVQNSLLVAPFGAAERAMSTAPVCIGVPEPGGVFLLDFATSAIAEGKALVAVKGGKAAPEGALIGADGRPTADPRVLYGASAGTPVPNPRGGPGALAPMGGHKGSGLAIACELLAGALTGSGAGGQDQAVHNGMLSIYLDPARLDDGHGWSRAVRDYIAFVRGRAAAADVAGVQIPGDPERATMAERLRHGLPLPTAVWESLLNAARRVGLDPAGIAAPILDQGDPP